MGSLHFWAALSTLLCLAMHVSAECLVQTEIDTDVSKIKVSGVITLLPPFTTLEGGGVRVPFDLQEGDLAIENKGLLGSIYAVRNGSEPCPISATEFGDHFTEFHMVTQLKPSFYQALTIYPVVIPGAPLGQKFNVTNVEMLVNVNDIRPLDGGNHSSRTSFMTTWYAQLTRGWVWSKSFAGEKNLQLGSELNDTFGVAAEVLYGDDPSQLLISFPNFSFSFSYYDSLYLGSDGSCELTGSCWHINTTLVIQGAVLLRSQLGCPHFCGTHGKCIRKGVDYNCECECGWELNAAGGCEVAAGFCPIFLAGLQAPSPSVNGTVNGTVNSTGSTPAPPPDSPPRPPGSGSILASCPEGSVLADDSLSCVQCPRGFEGADCALCSLHAACQDALGNPNAVCLQGTVYSPQSVGKNYSCAVTDKDITGFIGDSITFSCNTVAKEGALDNAITDQLTDVSSLPGYDASSALSTASPYCNLVLRLPGSRLDQKTSCAAWNCKFAANSSDFRCNNVRCRCPNDCIIDGASVKSTIEDLAGGVEVKCDGNAASDSTSTACSLKLEGLADVVVGLQCHAAECFDPFGALNVANGGGGSGKHIRNPVIAAIPLMALLLGFILCSVAMAINWRYIKPSRPGLPQQQTYNSVGSMYAAITMLPTGADKGEELGAVRDSRSGTEREHTQDAGSRSDSPHRSTESPTRMRFPFIPLPGPVAERVVKSGPGGPLEAGSDGRTGPGPVSEVTASTEVADGLLGAPEARVSGFSSASDQKSADSAIQQLAFTDISVVVKQQKELISNMRELFTCLRPGPKSESTAHGDCEVGGGGARPCSKLILSPMSSTVERGTLVGILGPSGSGKSTLLNVLSGTVQHGGKWKISGSIRLDGTSVYPSLMAQLSAHVPQHDLIMRSLTVEECLRYSAAIRLDARVHADAVSARVETIIQDLGISHIRHSTCWKGHTSQISGGERTRVSIGMELVTDPHILMLDEPTSGLDSHTAHQLMNLLLRVAHGVGSSGGGGGGRIVIASIHQPSPTLFNLLDKVLLLAQGHMIYSGMPSGVEAAFIEHGLPMGPGVGSLAEHMLECVGDPETVGVLLKRVVGSNEAKRLQLQAAPPSEASCIHGKLPAAFSVRKRDTVREIGVIFWRTSVDVLRNPMLAFSHALFASAAGLIVGFSYFQSNLDIPGAQNRVGSIFTALIIVAFTAVSAMDLIQPERQLVSREISRRFYSPLTYMLSKLLLDGLILRTLPAILYGVPMYWLMGLVSSANEFFTFMCVLASFSCLIGCLCLCVANVTSSPGTAVMLSNALLFFTCFLSGFLVNLNSITWAIRWASYCSPFRYAWGALVINELKSISLDFSTKGLPSVPSIGGVLFLQLLGIDANNLDPYVIVVVAMYFGLAACAVGTMWLRQAATMKGWVDP